MSPNLQETADLVTFTEKNLNGKLHFLCVSVSSHFSLNNDFIKKAKTKLENSCNSDLPTIYVLEQEGKT